MSEAVEIRLSDAVRAMRDRGIDSAESLLEYAEPQAILNACAWWDGLKGVRPGLLVKRIKEGGLAEAQASPDGLTEKQLPPGPIFCVIRCRMAGLRPLSDTDARRQLRDLAIRAGVSRRVNPHSFRHTCAVDLWRESVPEYVIQQQLGHARLDVTAAYLRGLAPTEVLERVGNRRPPMMRVPGM